LQGLIAAVANAVVGTKAHGGVGSSMFIIEYDERVDDDLAGLRAFDRKKILDRIEEQLTHQANQPSRNRKIVAGLAVPWGHEGPVWELRAGGFRVFYDVSEEAGRVAVLAVRRKPPHKTTEEIL
jgi:mRNA-degrading endonuclease RelE of RelBE toxin-antitoxin system